MTNGDIIAQQHSVRKTSSSMVIIIIVFFFFLFFFLLKATWVVVSCYYTTPARIRKAMANQRVYGPEPKFLTGNLLDISILLSKTTSSDLPTITHDIVPRLLPHFLWWSNQYGKRFLFWYGSEPRLCLTETEMVREFLSSKYSHVTGRSWLQLQGSKHLIGRGLIMANGQDWCHQRRIVATTFTGNKLKSYMSYVVESTKNVLTSLHDVLGTNMTGECEVEIGSYMSRLAGDVISRAGFGSSYEKGKRIFQLLNSLQNLTAQSSRHLWFPGNRFFPSKFRREIKRLKAEIDGLLMDIIQSRKDRVEIGRSSSYGDDLLGTLLGEADKKNREDFKITPQLIMDECKTVYFAGHESSALLLTWTVMLLATNREWQEKARAEVVDVCRGQTPTTDHLCKFNLLNMIINESLRLYPPVAMLPRMVFSDIKLGDLEIPKGLSVWIPVLAIHHSKEIWGEDADEFNPERWVVGKSSTTHLRNNFLPFAAGPRNCVGQAFAVMEAKMVLAMLLKEFSFTISENYRHAPVNVLTLKPKHGVPILLKPIKP